MMSIPKYPFRGKMCTTGEIARALGCTSETVRWHIKRGEAPDDIVVNTRLSDSLDSRARAAGIPSYVLRRRMEKHGMTLEEAVAMGPGKRYTKHRISAETQEADILRARQGSKPIEDVMEITGLSRTQVAKVLPVDEIEEDEKRQVLRRYGYQCGS